MARTYKKHDGRKAELLATAQKLFYAKGYEATTVEDIISAAQVSKGAFYHYFASKTELLDCLVVQVSEQIVNRLKPIFADPAIGVIEKMREATNVGRDIKTANKELLKTYLKVMSREENLVLRHKLNQGMAGLILPLYTALVAQGVAEGVFDTPSPEFASRMILAMTFALQESYWQLFADIDEKPENVALIYREVKMYEDALERLLGAPRGSLKMINEADIRAFTEEKYHEHA